MSDRENLTGIGLREALGKRIEWLMFTAATSDISTMNLLDSPHTTIAAVLRVDADLMTAALTALEKDSQAREEFHDRLVAARVEHRNCPDANGNCYLEQWDCPALPT